MNYKGDCFQGFKGTSGDCGKPRKISVREALNWTKLESRVAEYVYRSSKKLHLITGRELTTLTQL
jgi:hypothetical protein